MKEYIWYVPYTIVCHSFIGAVDNFSNFPTLAFQSGIIFALDQHLEIIKKEACSLRR